MHLTTKIKEKMSMLMFILSVLFVCFIILGFAKPARSEELVVDAKLVRVVDGDTIKYDLVTYRLMGFDAPETFHSKCVQELTNGYLATVLLGKLIVNATEVKIEIRGLDKYKRRLAILKLDGVDIAGIMIKEGLAVEYHGKGQRTNWCEE